MTTNKSTNRLANLIILVIGLVGLMIVFPIIGCTSSKTEELKDVCMREGFIIVERQRADLAWRVQVIMDIPIDFSSRKTSPVRDSITSFLRREVHDLMTTLCEDTTTFDAHCDDWDDISSPYFVLEDAIQNTYSNKIEDVGGIVVTFALIAQTESFITYGLESFHCGGSCGSELYCYTFSKKDGHRIRNIINWDDIQRFIKDHPKAKHPYGQWQLEADNDFMNVVPLYDMALLNDGLLMVNEDEVNHYNVGKIAYEDVLPYLSQEAQELVRSIGSDLLYDREDWYLGRCIGKVHCDEDEPILLMQRESLWDGLANFNCVDRKDFVDEEVYSLTAYQKSDNKYVPQRLFEVKGENGRYCSRLEFTFPDVAWEGPSFDDEYYTFDNDILCAPYLKEECKVDLMPFKFDGHHFKVVNPEETRPKSIVIGELISDRNDSICLVGLFDDPISGSVSAYYVRNGLYYPAWIFPYYKMKVEYMIGDEPFVTSNPNKCSYAFDSDREKLYTIVSERTSLGGYGCFDRYDVYRFDGEKFVCEEEDGGFWLHPSIRKFGRLFYLGKSKDYLVRIDEMRSYDWRGLNEEDHEAEKKDNHRYRYAAWKHKDNMADAPDVIIENGYYDSNKGCYVFENDGYIYEVYADLLEVFNKGKKVLEQRLRVQTSINDN